MPTEDPQQAPTCTHRVSVCVCVPVTARTSLRMLLSVQTGLHTRGTPVGVAQ